MPKRWTTATPCSYLPVVLLVLVLPRCILSIRADKTISKEDHVSATVNATVLDSKGNPKQILTKDDGMYGQNSPKVDAKGIVIAPAPNHGVVDRQGCDPHTRFVVPPRTGHWVALLQRGNCTFKEKILKASAFNASAVLIYNNNSKEDTVKMGHEGDSRGDRQCGCLKDMETDSCVLDLSHNHSQTPTQPAGLGTGDTVAVMITESYGKEILGLLERNLTVLVSVVVGQHGQAKNINRGSLVFVSISFIVLMIISSAWLIFYFIQKIRFTNARDRSQVGHRRRLGDAAKKAIGKLTTRTVKKGDKETDPDFNHCAVCIEGYQLNDVVRILPCKHVFHKLCVDPWLNEHCTCPMCKLNILKALGIMPNLPCVDNVGFDMDHRIGRSQTMASQRTALVDLSSETSISLEPLQQGHPGTGPQIPSDSGELIPRTGEINIAVTSGHFFNRNSLSPLSLVCEMELPDTQASLDRYDDKS
ncbi:E3 ubiquitin-protein ligase RNF130-like isoform X2 [Oncorhynchus keta]|uniref:E3 ubiquitin-protein ligase RNF130-like isoform X2 n=1 Tax=Oncorhynchus keta TaxID=8018 RepID=UPI0015FD7FE5|nr:E3 ubiquitin-protein ligase RNF130-like isoform X2 [Oncorhynchus keta]